MKKLYLSGMVSVAALLWAATATAEGIRYCPDPAHKKINADDPRPMDEMFTLAEQGDTRAQFIIADMYQKGKGGLRRDTEQARRWFGESAMHGYGYALIRLAAMAKREKSPVEAWQWYSLAIETFDSGDEQHYAIQARNALAESAHLTQADFSEARRAIKEWKAQRDTQLRGEREAERRKNEEAAKAERERLATARQQDKKNPQQEKENEQN